jgi:phosphoenolpyruvate synthase/pyruvate phosphate dikinase
MMANLEFPWLGEQGAHDPRSVGGKAANLSLLAADFRVPPGFCIPSAAFDAVGPKSRDLDAREQDVWAPETETGERFGALIGAAYSLLAGKTGTPEPGVAVRSSGIDEDGQSASLAGLHDTFLNVVGAHPIADAALKCLASAFTDRAIAYRRDRGIDERAAGLAVLVQYLVPADVSAVAFSADPVTGDRSQVVINANWGLGESVASGTVTPDTFTVSKTDMELSGTPVWDRTVSDKASMTVPVPGGVKEVNVPKMMRSMPCLDEGKATEIGQLAVALEQHMGYAVDVECAFMGDVLYLLQCRPVTTLA